MSVASILRLTRNAQQLSQVDLASRLEVSARHISFLETGRARPSRDLVVAWMRELKAPVSVKNAALRAAGFSPHVDEDERDRRASDARTALMQIVDVHDPFPGLVFNADWRTLRINRGGRWLVSLIMPRYCELIGHDFTDMDLIDVMAHQDGLFCAMRNARAASEQLLRQIQLEALTCQGLAARVDKCAESLRSRFGIRPSLDRDSLAPVVSFAFETRFGELRFVMYQGSFGLLQDITPRSLRCELWFPADLSTRNIMTNMGGSTASNLRSDRSTVDLT